MSSASRIAVGERARASLRWGLALHLTIALVTGLGSGSLQANAGRLAILVPAVALLLIAPGIVGLLAGLTARLALRGWTGVVRFLLALATLLLWMVVAEATYAVWMGFHPFEYLAQANDWVEAGQLAIGCLSIVAVSLLGGRTREVAHSTRAPLRWGLIVTLATALLLGLGLGSLQAYAGLWAAPAVPLALALIGAGTMGLLAGLTVRLILRGWTEVLRFLIVLLALLSWLAVAEATYALWTGLSPLEYLRGVDNWTEMGQLAIGLLGATVGGVARQRSRSADTNLALLPDRGTAAPVRSAPRRLQSPGASEAAGPLRQTVGERLRRALLFPRLRQPGRIRRRPLPAGNSHGVKVIAKAEERCPYCLEVIERNDLRGRVVCEICGTPHHADCWEEGGGNCQMPHLFA